MFSHAVSAGKYPIKLNTEIVYWLLSVDKISMQNKNVVHIVILCCGFSFTTSIICYTISIFISITVSPAGLEVPSTRAQVG